jgi:sortase A
MTQGIALRWFERGLLTAGAVLAAWCAGVLIQAHRTQTMPIPPPSTSAPATPSTSAPATPSTSAPATRTLPADDTATPAPRPAAAGTWLARLEAPSVKMTATVLEGSDAGTLRRGAGHLEDTPLPGQPGNIGIAGHRDGIFRPLRRIQVGDPLTLTTSDRAYHYRISRTLIVRPEDVYVLDSTPKPTLTLVTCYPFNYVGHAPKRFIVQAELIDQQARIDR